MLKVHRLPSFRTWVFLPSKGCLKVFPVLLTEQKPHHVFCHRLCSPLETLVVREGKSLSMGVEGVGGLGRVLPRKLLSSLGEPQWKCCIPWS